MASDFQNTRKKAKDFRTHFLIRHYWQQGIFFSHLRLLHDVFDFGVLPLQLRVGLGHVGVAPLVLVIARPRLLEHLVQLLLGHGPQLLALLTRRSIFPFRAGRGVQVIGGRRRQAEHLLRCLVDREEAGGLRRRAARRASAHPSGGKKRRFWIFFLVFSWLSKNNETKMERYVMQNIELVRVPGNNPEQRLRCPEKWTIFSSLWLSS